MRIKKIMKDIKIEIICPALFLWSGLGLILLFVCISAEAQVSSNTIKEQFSLQKSPTLSEQLFLHLDRNDYIAGETIWFKAYYTLNNQFNQNCLSKTIYLELVDANGLSVLKRKYELINNVAYGSIPIPESALSGYYTLYVYTKWLRNMGNKYYSSSNIRIISPDKGVFIYKNDSNNENSLIVNFYPEGGKLVAGFNNKISYFARTQDGESIGIDGQILDKNNTVIAEFKSTTDNLNHFNFNPKKDETYRAIITRKDGALKFFNLPEVVNNGIGIKLENDTEEFITVQFDADQNAPAKNKMLNIEIEKNGFIYKTIEVLVLYEKNIKKILKSDMFYGINKITIKNQEGLKLYENFVEIPSKNEMDIALNLEKKIYNKREKVNIYIKTTKKNNIAIKSELSISIAKAKVEDIYIKENEFWKTNLSDEINYKKISKTISDSSQTKNKIEFLPETKNLVLSGKVVTKTSNQGIHDVNVYLSKLNKNQFVQNAISKSDGKFYFNFDNLDEKSELVIQITNLRNSEQKLIIDDEYSSDFLPIQNKALSNIDYNRKYFEKLLTNYQIQKEFTSKNEQNSIEGLNHSNIFYGQPDSTYYLKKYIDLPSLEDFINEIVKNVQIKKKKDDYEISISYGKSNTSLTKSPLLLLDGVPIFDNSKYLKIPPLEIEKMDIINTNYLLGDNEYGGIISLFSYKKNLANIASSMPFTFIHFDGYSEFSKFNEIKYGSQIEFDSRIPDFRNTLYWNPNIVTNKDGVAEVLFYTSDESGKFLITIEGLNSEGVSSKKQMIIEVNK